jgi:outer membrane protein assembly factor BamB
VVELFAALLRRVVAEALQSGVNAAGATVLTCPADWGPQRRQVLLAAARIAALGPVELVDEPIAAATYCVRVLGQQIAPLQSMAVFDFGGGTLDVSVVRREFDALRVMAVGGLDDLGGVDVDAALVGHLGQLIALHHPEVWQRLSAANTVGEQRDRRTLWSEVRAAKEMLSRTASAPVHVPGTEHALHLTREELERVAGPLVDRSVDETRRVLQRAGVTPVGILLVGGSSRIPLVASRLHARFGLAPTVPEQPELPVAYGALLYEQAGSLDASRPRPAPFASEPAAGMAGGPRTGPTAAPVSPGLVGPISPPSGYPVLPISGPPVPASTSFPPVELPQPVPVAPPVPKKKVGALRYVALVVAVALLATCGFGARAGYSFMTGLFDGSANGSPFGSNNGNNSNDGSGLGAGKALDKLGVVQLDGAGAVAVAASAGTAYYAVGGTGKTTVVALDPAGAKVKWRKEVAIEAAELKLRTTGSLLLVDGDRAATHQGKNARAVLNAKDGEQRWLGARDSVRDIAYFGDDAVVEVGRPKPELQRVELATGRVKWKRPGGDTFITSGDFWSGPVLVAGAPKDGQGTRGSLPWPAEEKDAKNFVEPIAVDARSIVMLNEDNGRGTLVDASNGNPGVSAALPLDYEYWVAYAGQIVGQLTDEAAPGRTVVAGYSGDRLAKLWEYPLPAGADIERLKPCGPQHVCIRADSIPGNSGYLLVSINLETGKEAWKKTYESAKEPDWYLTGKGLLVGREWFGSISEEPSIVDPLNGEVQRVLGPERGPMVVAGDGNRVLLRGTRVITTGGGSVRWQVAVADLGTSKVSGGVDAGAGEEQPVATLLAGDVVVVLTAERKVELWRAG